MQGVPAHSRGLELDGADLVNVKAEQWKCSFATSVYLDPVIISSYTDIVQHFLSFICMIHFLHFKKGLLQ